MCCHNYKRRKGGKGFERRSAGSLMDCDCFNVVFSKTYSKKQFKCVHICFDCVDYFRKRTVPVHKNSNKRKPKDLKRSHTSDTDTIPIPSKKSKSSTARIVLLAKRRLLCSKSSSSSSSSSSSTTTTTCSVDLESQLVNHLRASHYERLVNTLVRERPKCKDAVVKVTCKHIKQEVCTLSLSACPRVCVNRFW